MKKHLSLNYHILKAKQLKLKYGWIMHWLGKYINEKEHTENFEKYNSILGMLVTMITNPDKWTL